MNATRKHKILITMYSLDIGGVERSLVSLLHSFDPKHYDITLMLYRHGGAFMHLVPETVHLLPYQPAYDVFQKTTRRLVREGNLIAGFLRVLAALHRFVVLKFSRQKVDIYRRLQYLHRYLLVSLPHIPDRYDLAISYLGIHDIVIRKTDAAVKVGWIHSDYSQLNPDRKRDQNMYRNLDVIVNVSEECQKQFLQLYPRFSERSVVIENLLQAEIIRHEAEKPIDSEEMLLQPGETCLLSVGRFAHAKNFDRVPEICKKIRDSGVKVRWFLIGSGPQEALIRQQIDLCNVADSVILLGRKENPYPYMKRCDLYIQPSRYEGKSVAVREAQILGKPVVITRYPTSESQIRDGYDGVIVDQDADACANGIKHLIQNKQLQEILIQNCLDDAGRSGGDGDSIYDLLIERARLVNARHHM